MTEQSGFGRLMVERSGGIAGMLLVWDIDIDASSHREDLGQKVAELPWPDRDSGTADPGPASAIGSEVDSSAAQQAASGADRFVYLIESRFGRVRFSEGRMPQEWRALVDEVREVAQPQRRRPG